MDILTCVHHHTTIDEAGRLLARNSERFFKPARQMAAMFADIPHTLDAARALGERIEFTLENLGYQFPLYPVPPGETMDSFLRELTYKDELNRYNSHD